MGRTPWDADTEFRIERSESSVGADGYALGEPKRLVCDACGASVPLTCAPSAGVDELDHDAGCPQADVHSERFRRSE